MKQYNLSTDDFNGLCNYLKTNDNDYSDVYYIESLFKYNDYHYIINYYDETLYKQKILGINDIYSCTILVHANIINTYLREIILMRKLKKLSND